MLGIFYTLKAILNRNNKTKFFGHLISSAVFFLFLLVGSFFGSLDFYHTYKFRNIDVNNVSGFKVFRSEKENDLNNQNSVEINDKIIIENMLNSLKNCQKFNPEKSYFVDGYKINLIFKDVTYGNDFFISVYRKSSLNNSKNSVMPHKTSFRSVNLGDYNCPEFQNLVLKHIDPLFKN